MGLHLVLLAALGLVFLASNVSGHGSMIYPNIWQDFERRGLNDQRNPSSIGCGSIGLGKKKGCLTQWFTNNTVIPGESVIPEEFMVGKRKKHPKYPWNAPGTAPTLGGGCGVAGGNPDGCPPAGGKDDRPFGSPCGGYLEGIGTPGGAGGYIKGKPATSFSFPNATTTTWKIGSSQKVAWFSKAHHAGGYSYRLCKLGPKGKTGRLTEECFQKNVLDFIGNYVWTKEWPVTDDTPWVKTRALRTREGTFPMGSQWTRVPFPGRKTHTMMDKVLVSTDLTPGEYVLSFRWDSERTPQVWNGCANIELVN